MTMLRWLLLGTTFAAAIAAFVLSDGSSSDAAGGLTAVVTPTAVADPEPSSASEPMRDGTRPSIHSPAIPAADAPASLPPLDAPDPVVAVVAPLAAATPAPAPPLAASEPFGAEVRLRVPALGIDARVSPLGFDGAGGFAVPSTAAAVGWYEFSARPGAPGNTVLGGHLNWRGSSGVFDRLDELSVGDMIYIDTADGEFAYRVSGSHLVTAQTPFVDILGERSGPSTLTLFTCGGTFSSVAGEYDQRVVVDAVRV